MNAPSRIADRTADDLMAFRIVRAAMPILAEGLSAEDLAQVPGTLTADSLKIRDGHVELQLPANPSP